MENAFYQAFCDLAVSPLQNPNRKLLGRARKRPSAKEQLDPGIWLFSKQKGIAMEKLAIDGEPKVRTTPFPSRVPFGEREERVSVYVRGDKPGLPLRAQAGARGGAEDGGGAGDSRADGGGGYSGYRGCDV